LLPGTFSPAEADLSIFRTGDLEVRVAGRHAGPGWLAIDGSALVLCEPPPPRASARNAWIARVADLFPQAGGVRATLRCAGVALRARITAAAREALHLAPGSPVGVLLKATAPRILPRERSRPG